MNNPRDPWFLTDEGRRRFWQRWYDLPDPARAGLAVGAGVSVFGVYIVLAVWTIVLATHLFGDPGTIVAIILGFAGLIGGVAAMATANPIRRTDEEDALRARRTGRKS